MKELFLCSDSEIATLLSTRIKKERIIQNIKQKELADKADVSIDILRNFEQKGKITLVNLISILRALGKTSLFEELFDFEKARIEYDASLYNEKLKEKYTRIRVK